MTLIRIYNQDTQKWVAENKHIQQSFGIIISDPPYYGCVQDEWDNQWSNWDEYVTWFKEAHTGIAHYLKPDGNMLVYTSRQMSPYAHLFFEQELGWFVQRTIIWSRKRDINRTRWKTLGSGYEPILWVSPAPNAYFNNTHTKIEPLTT